MEILGYLKVSGSIEGALNMVKELDPIEIEVIAGQTEKVVNLNLPGGILTSGIQVENPSAYDLDTVARFELLTEDDWILLFWDGTKGVDMQANTTTGEGNPYEYGIPIGSKARISLNKAQSVNRTWKLKLIYRGS